MKKLLIISAILIAANSGAQDLSPKVDRCVSAAKLAGLVVSGIQAGAQHRAITSAIDGSGLPPQQIDRLRGLRDLTFANSQRGVNEIPKAKFDAAQVQVNYYLSCIQ